MQQNNRENPNGQRTDRRLLKTIVSVNTELVLTERQITHSILDSIMSAAPMDSDRKGNIYESN